MSIVVGIELIENTTHSQFEKTRKYANNYRHEDVLVDIFALDDEALHDLVVAAGKVNDGKTERALRAFLSARSGEFNKVVPNFKAFMPMLTLFLTKNASRGWIYVRGDDGELYPELVRNISLDQDRNARNRDSIPKVSIRTDYYGRSPDDRYKVEQSTHQRTHAFYPTNVTNKRLTDILEARGIYVESEALHDQYDADLERYHATVSPAFGEQFRLKGCALSHEPYDRTRAGMDMTGTKAVCDLEPSLKVRREEGETILLDSEVSLVPIHPVTRLFDLERHDYLWAHVNHLVPYEYDKSLRDKLILPVTHRDLLDILTSDIDVFTSDIIEGKSAGNVILCKGKPGVGKTLTAEVYAELIGRPLYKVHSGNLGTTASEIEKNLQTVFKNAKRWRAVLLLDEADVFIVARGQNIEQNAIVAEFLRALEYFDGLMFMTTNRPHDIDEAIVSRCAAIIDYKEPDTDDMKRVWGVMARNFDYDMPAALIDQVTQVFTNITPRDVKMLLRLSLRVARSEQVDLDIEIMRRCAMFRAIDMEAVNAASLPA